MKILPALIFLLGTSLVAAGQTGPTREWYSCAVAKVVKQGKIKTSYHRCPELEKEKGISELRVVGLEGIPKVEGTEYFLRVSGQCLIAYTVADQARERFIRHAINVDCDNGRKFLQMLVPPKKAKG